MIKALLAPVLAIVTLLAITACDTAKKETVKIVGAGSTFPGPVLQRWIDGFKEKHDDVEITYWPVGSDEGIRRFLAEDIDFASSSAPLLQDEILQVKRPIQLMPMTGGIIAVAYNIPGIKSGLNLPEDVMVEAFLGKPLFWNDPRLKAANPDMELPQLKIQPVVRGRSSGTSFVFASYLQRTSEMWRESGLGAFRLIDWPGSAMTVKKNDGIAQRIQVTPGAIGYLQFGLAKYVGLSVAALQNAAGKFVYPSLESGKAAIADLADIDLKTLKVVLPIAREQDYPIVSLTWLIFYKEYDDPRKLKVIKDALRWRASEEGQAIAQEMGYISLPQEMAEKVLEAVDQL